MKATRAQVERAMEGPSDAVRLFLLYGPDEAASRDLASRLGKALGADAERIDLTGALLKSDPARLADEAAAISLFGGARHIRVEPAGDEILPAVEGLLSAGAAGNPVAVIAGALRKDSKLLKLALADLRVLALASYVPEGADADRLVIAIGRELGLQIRPDLAHRIAAAMGGDRALIARECEKLALYADASPEHPREIDHDVLDALGADVEEGDLSRLINAVLGGRLKEAQAELTSLSGGGVDAIPIVRAMLRRLHLLADLRASVEQGNGVEAVMNVAGKALFWKDKPAISQQLSRWGPDRIGIALERMLEAERAVKRPGGLGMVAVAEELMTIGRAAARMR